MEAYIEMRSEWRDKKKEPRIIAMTAGDAVQEIHSSEHGNPQRRTCTSVGLKSMDNTFSNLLMKTVLW